MRDLLYPAEMEKRCSRCREEKYLVEFGKLRSSKDGHAHWCKACRKQKYLQDRERPEFREAAARRRAENRETQRGYMKRYWAENKEKLNQQTYDIKKANPEKYRASRRLWDRRMGSGHRGRARRHGVAYSAVNKTAIFERDGWICRLCNDPVDKTSPGPTLSPRPWTTSSPSAGAAITSTAIPNWRTSPAT